VTKLVALLMLTFLIGACVHTERPARGVPRCEESSHFHCLTAAVCDFDPARGCELCRCGPAPFDPLQKPDGIQVVERKVPPGAPAKASSGPPVVE
jgi:hypothetical protein